MFKHFQAALLNRLFAEQVPVYLIQNRAFKIQMDVRCFAFHQFRLNARVIAFAIVIIKIGQNRKPSSILTRIIITPRFRMVNYFTMEQILL